MFSLIAKYLKKIRGCEHNWIQVATCDSCNWVDNGKSTKIMFNLYTCSRCGKRTHSKLSEYDTDHRGVRHITTEWIQFGYVHSHCKIVNRLDK